MNIDEDYLAHYGVLRRSGRYPWGSGGPEHVSENPGKRNKEFLDFVSQMKSEGLSEKQIADGIGISVAELRDAKSVARTEYRLEQITIAQRLKDTGMSNTAIGSEMGINESSVRALLADGVKERADILKTTADMLKDQVEKKTYLDVGKGQEQHIGVTKHRLNAAIASLKEEGYLVHTVKLQQPGTGHMTTYKVLVKPGVTQRDVFMNNDKIQGVTSFTDDGGRTRFGLVPPLAISARRVGIAYKEDGGDAADGVMYVRRGVEDISLGKASYAQVRVQVGQTHYLKGMAMYRDDLPDGVDILFNTNKSDTGNKLDALKPLKKDENGDVDQDNPFGAQISHQILNTTKTKPKSVMNIVNEEGDWGEWAKSISAQALSKQNPTLAKQQLDVTYDRRKREFDEISALTNPTVKKKLLEAFADGTDSAAVHLKAAELPRSAWQVILPVKELKPTEIYAPRFRPGERVVLIRYPHGGTFEIPELTVNNKHPVASKLLADAKDAVGIHPDTAARLSGADFDGDTVLVIPNSGGKVKVSPALEGLKDFDPLIYKIPKGSNIKVISASQKQQEMGKVSNLITDMTLKGASHDEIARAVRHSMVVIDSEKHELNHKQSAKDNGIKALKAKYQKSEESPGGGAATLISRAKSETHVPETKFRPAAEGGKVDRETGKIVLVPTGRLGRNGEPAMKKAKKLEVTDDAHTLSSGTRMERLYADHSNKLKSLANTARLVHLNTEDLKSNPSAKKVYASEVSSLDAKLALAYRNKPLERQALVIANTTIQAKKQADPNMDKTTEKKVKAQALAQARLRTGATPNRIELTQPEWDAIQAGAISHSKLNEILNNANLDQIKELATPKTRSMVTTAEAARAKQMLAHGATRAEVASALGVSISTLDRSME